MQGSQIKLIAHKSGKHQLFFMSTGRFSISIGNEITNLPASQTVAGLFWRTNDEREVSRCV